MLLFAQNYILLRGNTLASWKISLCHLALTLFLFFPHLGCHGLRTQASAVISAHFIPFPGDALGCTLAVAWRGLSLQDARLGLG